MTTDNKKDFPIISFESSNEMESWLEANHAISNGIWLKFFKKNSGIKSIYYAEALDVALCYGWIDSQLKSLDEKAYLQKFTPRRAKSIWSKRNIEHVSRLEKDGRMKPSGFREVEAAKADGRWEKAYDSPVNIAMPEDFYEELKKNKKSYEFYESLSKANKYAIIWRIQTAKKPETREKRLRTILEMLSKGDKFHN